MADMLATGASWLVDKLAASASQTVSITRGVTSATTGVTATKCPVKSEGDPEFGILRITDCDWIIKATLYKIGGTQVEPQKNDLITDAGGDIWQVLSPFAGEQEYRPFDPQATAWRIHTKRTET